MQLKWIPLVICSLVLANSQDIKTVCTCVRYDRTYLCSGVNGTFPSMLNDAYIIQCTGCEIPVIGPGTFPKSEWVHSFNLSSSGIENITGNAFSMLHNLRYLYLQNNKIFGIEPGAFRGFAEINEINLDHNALTHLIPGIFDGLQAIAVHLSHNRIWEIPSGAFEGVDQITTFNLSFNDIAILYKDSLKGLSTMKTLDLQFNKICRIPLGMFQYNYLLRDLDLKGNRLVSFLPGTFSGLKRLVTINLANNRIYEFDWSLLLPMAALYSLDISRNILIHLDAHAIRDAAPTLKLIILKDNIWNCDVLASLTRYFKVVGIDTFGTGEGWYDVININGIMCSMEGINYAMPFDEYKEKVKAISDHLSAC